MIEYTIYPATTSNQITKSYYFSLLDQINRGTCSKTVKELIRRNGTYEYSTYHLTSVM